MWHIFLDEVERRAAARVFKYEKSGKKGSREKIRQIKNKKMKGEEFKNNSPAHVQA